MNVTSQRATAPRIRFEVPKERKIGQVIGREPGPTLVCVASIHGNEPAGIEAARRVFARLGDGSDLNLRGELVVFAGNLASLQKGVRYQAKDLNRVWTESQVGSLRSREATGGELDPEDKEQLELLENIHAAVDRARGQVHLADLHTSSAEGIPFILFGDTLEQREFVRVFPIPVIIGLEEQVDGVLSEYWTRRNCITFACEGGQHDDPLSIDSLEAVIWMSLSKAGMIERTTAEVAKARNLLDTRRGALPRMLEVVERKAITPEDKFKMEPGFRNIAPAKQGQLLATDRNGEIRAPDDGLVILPLYQGLGSDGYFWGRTVSQVRLRASALIRRSGAEKLLPLLPGVTRDPSNPQRFRVNTNIARIYPLDVFHLFGFRRVRQNGAELTVERQTHTPPRS